MAGTWFVTLTALLVRVALWLHQPGLTYDGTYYLRQAERLLRGDFQVIGFPPGYPLVVALVRVVAGDFELAGRVVSLVAGTATVALFHLWARRHLPGRWALAAALFLAVHPEVARQHVEILSEPLYIFCIVLGFTLFEKGRDLAAGALFGYAFLVRPEAVALLLGCAVSRLGESPAAAAGAVPAKVPAQAGGARRLPLRLLGTGLLPVILYSALSSHAIGHWVLTPKQGQLDLDADIGPRLWKMLTSLHVLFPLLLLPGALAHGLRARRSLLAGVVYMAVLPFFAIHIQPRLLQPALPFLLLLGLAWVADLRSRWHRPVLAAAAVLAVWGAVAPFRALFRASIVTPYDRMLGAQLRPHLRFEDRVACRFPIVPYYAGAGFAAVPLTSYVGTMDSLAASGATHLLVLEHEVLDMLPQLRPLFENAGFATAEGRLEPVVALAPPEGPRALLYRFRPPAITAPARWDSTAVAAAWAGQVLVFATRDGRVHVSVDSTALATTAAFAASEVWRDIGGVSDVCASADGERLAFVQEVNGSLQLTEFDKRSGILRPQPLTAGDAPGSPCYVGDLLVYVRRRGAGGLRVLDPGRGRVRAVTMAGLEPTEAQPLFVTARDDTVLAITYVRPQRERDDHRVVATARWPATVGAADTAVVLTGRWATQHALADDSVAWVPGEDRLLVTVAVRELDNDGRVVGSFSSLAMIDARGRARALSFGIPTPRRPAVGDGRLAFLAGRTDLCVAPLHAEDLRFPEVQVFGAPREAVRRSPGR